MLNSAGTLLGFVFAGVVSHISLSDKSTAAGVWTIENNELVGASAQLLTSTMTSIEACIALDSDREFLLGNGTSSYSYGVVYRKSTNTFSAVTTIRSSAVAGKHAAILQTTNQVLVVNPVFPFTLEATICSINASNDTITVNSVATGAYHDVFQAFIDGCGLIAVGTSFIVSLRTSSTCEIHEITVSGTTPTVSTGTVLGGTAGGLIVAGDSTHVIAVSTATTHLYTKPYTIGGLAAGTGTDTAIASGATIRALTTLGSYFAVITSLDTSGTVLGGVITLTGTTTTISTANLFTAGIYADAIVVGSNKVLCTSVTSSEHINILTNTSGTASVGTILAHSNLASRTCVAVIGTDVYVQANSSPTCVIYKINCSGASAVTSNYSLYYKRLNYQFLQKRIQY
ncbi:MAG: hypothetical protein NT098_01835 [Candidatus Parcubacteria bacterium]|nr:hypothetical protein [Candidatus Parcubacteria bacterium]